MWDYGVKCETGHGNKFFTWTTPDMSDKIRNFIKKWGNAQVKLKTLLVLIYLTCKPGNFIQSFWWASIK